jgi:hypothetical protein
VCHTEVNGPAAQGSNHVRKRIRNWMVDELSEVINELEWAILPPA